MTTAPEFLGRPNTKVSPLVMWKGSETDEIEFGAHYDDYPT